MILLIVMLSLNTLEQPGARGTSTRKEFLKSVPGRPVWLRVVMLQINSVSA